jgi:hypothetical protein
VPDARHHRARCGAHVGRLRRTREAAAGNPEVRETRGFVYLTLNDADKALQEYDAALKANPHRPLALFGRSLARDRTGDAKGSIADKDAARALFPDVAREFTPYGLR